MQTTRHGNVVTALVEASEERWVKSMSKSLYLEVLRQRDVLVRGPRRCVHDEVVEIAPFHLLPTERRATERENGGGVGRDPHSTV